MAPGPFHAPTYILRFAEIQTIKSLPQSQKNIDTEELIYAKAVPNSYDVRRVL